jgi:hypothetical protein
VAVAAQGERDVARGDVAGACGDGGADGCHLSPL